MFRLLELDDQVKLIHLWTRTSAAFGFSTWVPLLGDGMVDSGFPRAEESLLKALGSQPIRRIVHTHSHEDHIGNDFVLQSRFNTELYVKKDAINEVAEPEKLSYFFYEKIMWGIPRGVRKVLALPPTIEVGNALLHTIETPGHSPDHVVFFHEEQRRVFGGDIFLSVKVRVARPQENNIQTIDSIKRVLELKPRQLICTHKGVVEDPIPILTAKLEFLEKTRDEVLRLNDQGLEPARIAREVLGKDSPLMYFGTSRDVNKLNMVLSFLR